MNIRIRRVDAQVLELLDFGMFLTSFASFATLRGSACYFLVLADLNVCSAQLAFETWLFLGPCEEMVFAFAAHTVELGEDGWEDFAEGVTSQQKSGDAAWQVATERSMDITTRFRLSCPETGAVDRSNEAYFELISRHCVGIEL